jgi:glycosyltransferase involved in cell wall biosynthesis
VPSGIDPSEFDEGAPDPFPAVPRPRIGYVGRLAAQKDVPTLVEAFGHLRTRASLVIVGEGPDEARVTATIRDQPEDVRARIHRRGFVRHHEIPAVLRHLDVLALPSRYEELGSVLLEALHTGVPVVASRVGGIPEVIEDGVTGLLAPPGDPAAFASALARVIDDVALRRQMSASGRLVAPFFHWDSLAGDILSIYEHATTPA